MLVQIEKKTLIIQGSLLSTENCGQLHKVALEFYHCRLNFLSQVKGKVQIYKCDAILKDESGFNHCVSVSETCVWNIVGIDESHQVFYVPKSIIESQDPFLNEATLILKRVLTFVDRAPKIICIQRTEDRISIEGEALSDFLVFFGTTASRTVYSTEGKLLVDIPQSVSNKPIILARLDGLVFKTGYFM